MAIFDEQSRKMDDLFKRLENYDDSKDKNAESFPTLSTFDEENDENIEPNVLCGLEELSSKIYF